MMTIEPIADMALYLCTLELVLFACLAVIMAARRRR